MHQLCNARDIKFMHGHVPFSVASLRVLAGSYKMQGHSRGGGGGGGGWGSAELYFALK